MNVGAPHHGGSQCAPEEEKSSTSGRKKALLIGIRDCGPDYAEIPTAHEDAYKMRDLLLEKYDYKPAWMSILVDDGILGHVQPTRANILLAIAELVEDVKDGDRLFFLYCGSATQIMSRSNSTEHGVDSFIVPSDGEHMRIMDNELNAALVAPLPSGAHLVAVLDASYSGTLLNLEHYRCNRVFVPWIEKGRRTSEDIRNRIGERSSVFATSNLSYGQFAATLTSGLEYSNITNRQPLPSRRADAVYTI
ncbi:caspase domain-containing protein [Mycena capillaripes]|nr:caspase domain-containing protein [Mycena capillaripes]